MFFIQEDTLITQTDSLKIISEDSSNVKKIMPAISAVKERIAEDTMKMNTYFEHLIKNLIDFAPSLISGIFVLCVGLWLIKRVARIAEKAMIRRDLEVSLRTFLKSLINIGLKIVLVVTVAGMIGIGTTSFVTILGAAGLAVGLALQGSLSNFAGGVLILIFKPFKVGDTIEAGGQTGTVKEIQIFNTILLTGEHKTVILANGPLSNGTIINNTRHGDLRIEVELRVSHNSDLTLVKKIIRDTLKANPKVINPESTDISIGKSAEGILFLYVRPYCLPSNTGSLSNELYETLKLEFEKNNIKLGITK
ncbi:MAG: mechanosensitive ion channel [Bacteroidetes bacterium]|nr:mechanosensitive ion channel [Bacteroidota bacterium]